jgi:hypothetical protein
MDGGFALMEKTMSKSNDVSTRGHRPLADSELDAVTGGIFREPTYHPAKVTIPDIKLSISQGDLSPPTR